MVEGTVFDQKHLLRSKLPSLKSLWIYPHNNHHGRSTTSHLILAVAPVDTFLIKLCSPANSLLSTATTGMKKINLILRKCKSMSRHLGRSSSYSSLRSMTIRDHHHEYELDREETCTTVYVGSTRKHYLISSKYLSHPLLCALVDGPQKAKGGIIVIRCEVVVFDHLLWMLENADPNVTHDSSKELAELYFLS